MTDNPRANETPVATNPEAPMPSAEQTTAKPTEGTPVDAPKEVTTSQEEVNATDDLELPEGTSERTREQFDKLKTQLREERSRKTNVQNVFEQLRPAQPAVTQEQINSFVDPVTGQVDINGLNTLIYSTHQRAARAEQTVQGWIEGQQEKEAYTSHPDLDPNNLKSFNRTLFNKTRAVLMDSMLNPQDYNGKPLTVKEAGDLAKGVTSQAIDAAEKAGAQKAIESLTPKEQASLEATGRSDRRNDVGDYDQLRQKTRKGDSQAIMERLRNIPAVGR